MIEIKDLCKEYRIGKIISPALAGINLRIVEGEFLAIAGPSGSGKTTLLNIIGCLDIPTKGEVLINNVNTNQLNPKEKAEFRRQKLGFIFQTFNLIPVLTAFENVEIPLILFNLAREERREKIMNMLKEVGIADFARRRPNEMSGGQQQRVAIARALVKNPVLVLADEPTANLDSVTAKEILELMMDLNHKFKTIFVFSTHDRLVMDFAHRLINLRDGKVISDEEQSK